MKSPAEENLVAVVEPAEANRISPHDWVSQHGDYLFRHAIARTGKVEIAEDLVQETFLAAWRSAARFAGRASERTWLLRILRNKIADHYRTRRPEFQASDNEALVEFEAQQFAPGRFGGSPWQATSTPGSWPDARQDLERSEFWETLHQCTHKLPEKTARVFLLRELDGWESDAICKELAIKPSHLFVLLHRARLALRHCLERNWFQNLRARK